MRPQPLPDNAFARKFLNTLPPELAESFTPDQLVGVQRAFGLRHGPRHPLDLRRSLWTPWGRIYLVLLVGPERRSDDRRRMETVLVGLGRAADVAVSATVALIVVLGLLGVLYTLKLMLGIDLVPGVDMVPDEQLIQEIQRR